MSLRDMSSAGHQPDLTSLSGWALAMTEPWHTSHISILHEYSKEKCKVGIQEILKGQEKKGREDVYIQWNMNTTS